MILGDLVHLLEQPHPGVPFLQERAPINAAIDLIHKIIKNHKPSSNTTSPTPTPSSRTTTPSFIDTSNLPPAQCTRSKINHNAPPKFPTNLHPIGTIVRKKFDNKYHEGEIIAYDPQEGYYKVKFQDGDIEEYDSQEIDSYRKRRQVYTHSYVPPLSPTPPST